MKPGRQKDNLWPLFIAVCGMLLACGGAVKGMDMLTCLGLLVAAVGMMMDS